MAAPGTTPRGRLGAVSPGAARPRLPPPGPAVRPARWARETVRAGSLCPPAPLAATRPARLRFAVLDGVGRLAAPVAGVDPVAAVHLVGAPAAEDEVVPAAAPDLVVALVAEDGVVVGA